MGLYKPTDNGNHMCEIVAVTLHSTNAVQHLNGSDRMETNKWANTTINMVTSAAPEYWW